MNERIESLANKTVSGEMYVYPVKTEYDRCDLFLPPIKMSGKRVCEYIRNIKKMKTLFNFWKLNPTFVMQLLTGLKNARKRH